MAQASWSYEMPPGGSGAVGLEDYMLLDERGETIGSVAVVLDRNGTRYVVGEIGTPPFARDRRAIPWSGVATVDHESLKVVLAPGALANAVRLDSDRAVENGPADARRVTELVTEIHGATSPERGPVDSQRYIVAFALGVAALLATLAAIIVVAVADGGWRFAVLAVPVALGIGALAAVYWMVRQPYA